MSKQIINQILGVAIVDEDFANQLLKDPLKAIQEKGFLLNDEEQQVLNDISANTLTEFTQCLAERLKYAQPGQN